MRNTLVFVCIAIILGMNIAKSQTIGGDYQNLEPGLQGRQDILFFEGFSTTAWGNNWDNANEGENTTMSTTGFDNNSLNVFLKQGSIGISGSGNTGMAMYLRNFPGVQSLHEEMYFRYYIYLDPNFDFSQGGKIPGMASHALYGAGRHPTGGDGWTARYMWNSYGELFLYAYLPGKSGFGTHEFLDYSGNRARLQKGKWHCVEQYIKLNSVSGSTGNADGKCYTWLDGNLCLKLEDIVYRTVINDIGKEFGIYSSIFFGGADADWAPLNDTYIKIDNMVLAKNYIGPRTGANVLTTPTIVTQGGTFSNQVDVSITANADEIRYTTNGQEPNYWSNKYTNPFKVAKSATVKARAYSSSNVRYSGTSSEIYTINTTTGTTNTIKSASADSYFRNGHAYEKSNYGTEGTLELKSGSFSYDRKAAIKFSIGDLTTFHSAKLRIYAASASAASKIGFFEMSSNWTETSITSLNAPICGDLLQTAVISAAGWIEIDATNYVSSQISQGATEVAFYVMVMNDEESNVGASLRSRTATSNKPELVIVNGTLLSNESEIINVGTLHIYPNPASEIISVVNTIGKDVSLEIFSIDGSLAKRITTKTEMTKINVSDLTKGLYFIVVQTNDGRITQKLVIE